MYQRTRRRPLYEKERPVANASSVMPGQALPEQVKQDRKSADFATAPFRDLKSEWGRTMNDTWFINSGSVTRMHKPKPLFYPRYAICELKNDKKDWVFHNVVFKCSEKDIFNEIAKRTFNDFISSIESKSIESNALDYMFEKAKGSLNEYAFNTLNDLYGEVR